MRDRGHLIMTHRKGQKTTYKFFQREDYYNDIRTPRGHD